MIDPFDKQLEDTQRIMEKYQKLDALNEQKEKERHNFELPGDPTGGISKLYSVSINHKYPDDIKFINEVLEKYSQGSRDSEGLPNSNKRVLNKLNAELAAQEIINEWAEVTIPALEKFMNENFDKAFATYDSQKTNKIDLEDGVSFI